MFKSLSVRASTGMAKRGCGTASALSALQARRVKGPQRLRIHGHGKARARHNQRSRRTLLNSLSVRASTDMAKRWCGTASASAMLLLTTTPTTIFFSCTGRGRMALFGRKGGGHQGQAARPGWAAQGCALWQARSVWAGQGHCMRRTHRAKPDWTRSAHGCALQLTAGLPPQSSLSAVHSHP